jgi:hypothetical protein
MSEQQLTPRAKPHTVLVAFNGIDFGRDDSFTDKLSPHALRCYDGTGFDFETKERHHFFYTDTAEIETVKQDIQKALEAASLTAEVRVTMRE